MGEELRAGQTLHRHLNDLDIKNATVAHRQTREERKETISEMIWARISNPLGVKLEISRRETHAYRSKGG